MNLTKNTMVSIISKNQFLIQSGQLPHQKTSAGLRKYKVSFLTYPLACLWVSQKLTTLKLSDNIKQIEDDAFYNCKLLSYVIYKNKVYANRNEILNTLKDDGVKLGKYIFDYTQLT